MKKKLIKALPYALLAVFAVVAIVLHEQDDHNADLVAYCEMVQLFEETGGESGYPDYRRIADKVCQR